MANSAATLYTGPQGPAGSLTANVTEVTGTSRVLTDGDIGKLLKFTNNGTITLTVPSGLSSEFFCNIVQYGTGQVVITASSTTIQNIDSATKTEGQYAIASIVAVATDTFVTSGRLVA